MCLKSWKYQIFVPVCKGSDRVKVQTVQREQHYNEIGHFKDARYVLASEALWRLFQYYFTDKYHTLVRLGVHLEHHHTVNMKEGQQDRADPRSRLEKKNTDSFNANRKWPGARHIKFSDYSCYFALNKSTKSWNPRVKIRLKPSKNAEQDNDNSEEH